MLAQIGQFLLIILILKLIFFLCVEIRLKFLKIPTQINYYQRIILLNFILLSTCMLLLISSFVLDDYSVKLVANHSQLFLPLYYKVAASFGQHEGSILLFVQLLSLSGVILFFNKGFVKCYGQIVSQRNIAFVVYAIIMLAFLLYVFFTSNPFERLLPPPPMGNGFNPVLQDFLLTIHPPFLYIGYVLQFPIYIIGLQSIGNNSWLGNIALLKFFANLSLAFLTLGIALGSFWAFYELGWGGFWAWDPVENASVLPWFVTVAQIHLLASFSSKGNKNLPISFLPLSTIAGFVFAVLSLFLVRSSLITSVHSFALSPLRGAFLLGLLSLVILLILVVFLKAKKQKPLTHTDEEVVTNLQLVHYFALMFCLLSILIIFLGLLYPLIFVRSYIGASYYNLCFLLLSMLFFWMLMIVAKVKNKQSLKLIFLNLAFKSLVFVVSVLFLLKFNFTFVISLVISLSLLIIFSTSRDIFLQSKKIRYLNNGVLVVLRQSFLQNKANIAHFSVGVFLLGIACGGGLKTDIVKQVGLSQNVYFDDIAMSFVKHEKIRKHNFIAYRATIEARYNQENWVFYPTKKYFPQSDTFSIETAFKFIWEFPNKVGVLYLNYGGLSEDGIILQMVFFPLLPLIYFGPFILIIIIVINLLLSRKKSVKL